MESFIPEAQEAAITEYALENKSTDVLEMANALMREASIRFHGPEHHYLITAPLITAYCNATGREDEKEELLRKSFRRTKLIPPGSCGFYGVCGNVLSVGVVLSLLMKATPLSTTELKLVNGAAGEAQRIMASFDGPRCCKRATYQNLAVAVACLKRLLDVQLEYPEKIACQFSADNETCSKEACPFHTPSA